MENFSKYNLVGLGVGPIICVAYNFKRSRV